MHIHGERRILVVTMLVTLGGGDVELASFVLSAVGIMNGAVPGVLVSPIGPARTPPAGVAVEQVLRAQHAGVGGEVLVPLVARRDRGEGAGHAAHDLGGPLVEQLLLVAHVPGGGRRRGRPAGR
ncbi:hypothetical protein [Streptomyces sp. B3I8]|uniref:hypothetical protein n=1 Tax=Streptomyces sp. B3I8 TaxID=3042303 RepID=UPI0027D7E85C|nr:hypothetical protein [Streptomyces sp. B3I8]